MKTITNLTATNATDDGKPIAAPMAQPSFMRRGKTITPPFSRRQRLTARGIYFESSNGGQVLITNESLWAAAEQHEPLLKSPPVG